LLVIIISIVLAYYFDDKYKESKIKELNTKWSEQVKETSKIEENENLKDIDNQNKIDIKEETKSVEVNDL
jgi:hypothetical protein